MQYNTERCLLKVPELGRNIHNMVEYLKTIPNKDKRTLAAITLVKAITCLNRTRNIKDSQQEIWNQIFTLVDYNLDIDIPYNIPEHKKLDKKDFKLSYPIELKRYRYYGVNILKTINTVIDYKEHPNYLDFLIDIANNMKKLYLIWNKVSIDDHLIFDHLKELSKERINLKGKNIELKSFSKLVASTFYNRENTKNERI